MYVDHWDPDKVYPEWSDDVEIGLVRLARIREITSDEARRLARLRGWSWNGYRPNSVVSETRLWKLTGTEVEFGVSFANDIVRPLTVISGLDRIPVAAGGVGNIPEIGNNPPQYRTDRPQRGASILDTNRGMYKQINRQFSFLQQLLHDTANPKTYEVHRRGSGQIVKSREEFYTRGAHYKLQEGEDIGVIELPSIPPEGTELVLAIRNMIQRGGFSDATFGNIAGQVTALVISQSAEAAQQITTPYHQAMEFVCTEISRYWVDILVRESSSYSFVSQIERDAFELFREENVTYRVSSNYAVQVPGDTAARIVMAKQASPGFELAPETAMRLFMPEITDPKQEISKVRAARAENHPVV